MRNFTSFTNFQIKWVKIKNLSFWSLACPHASSRRATTSASPISWCAATRTPSKCSSTRSSTTSAREPCSSRQLARSSATWSVFYPLSLFSLLFTSITLYNYRIDHEAKRANLVPSRHRAQLLPDANRRLDQLASQGEVRREANQATKRVI